MDNLEIVGSYTAYAEMEGADYLTVWFKGKLSDNQHIAITFSRFREDMQLTKTDWSPLGFNGEGLSVEQNGYEKTKRKNRLESNAGTGLKWKGFFRGTDKKWYEDK